MLLNPRRKEKFLPEGNSFHKAQLHPSPLPYAKNSLKRPRPLKNESKQLFTERFRCVKKERACSEESVENSGDEISTSAGTGKRDECTRCIRPWRTEGRHRHGRRRGERRGGTESRHEVKRCSCRCREGG